MTGQLASVPATPTPEGKWTASEVAAALGVHPVTVKKWLRQGRLHAAQAHRYGPWWFDPAYINELVASPRRESG